MKKCIAFLYLFCIACLCLSCISCLHEEEALFPVWVPTWQGIKYKVDVTGGDRRYGFIDESGKCIIPLEYDYAFGFAEGLAHVSKDGRGYYINKENAEIHFIGALQTNKVKHIIDKVTMIHSLDRLSLAEEINKQAKKIGKTMNVLCEVNVGGEESKSGLTFEEVLPFLTKISTFSNIKVCGLMSIPPIMTSISTQKQYFQKIMDLYIDISAKKIDNIDMSVLSIGMSSDFDLAIECGSNLVRIGTAAFGNRNYN